MRYYTADLHLHHPFVAAVRGFYKPDRELTPELIQLKRDVRDAVGSGRSDLNRIIRKIGEEAFEKIVDVRRHDDHIIKHINATIGKNDELVIAGDLSAGGIGSLADALKRIDELHVPPARRYLLLGNHEGFHMRGANAEMLATRFSDVSETSYRLLGGKFPAVISHVPAKHRLNGRRDGRLAENALSKTLRKHAPDIPYRSNIYHLHGHTHATRPNEFGSPFEVNIGLDAWGLKPVSEETLADHIEKSMQSAQARRK